MELSLAGRHSFSGVPFVCNSSLLPETNVFEGSLSGFGFQHKHFISSPLLSFYLPLA